MTGTLIAGALALALGVGTSLVHHTKDCPMGATVKKTILVPLVEKPAYSKDIRQYIYVRKVVEVPAKKARCACKDK